MAHTSEQRDNLSTPLCGSKKRSGGTCRAFAGQGTDHKGIGLCRYHGGNTPNGKKHATALEIKQRAVKLGQPIEGITPVAAMLGLLRATAGTVEWLRDSIMELDDLGTAEAAVLLRMYDDERDRLTRISEAAVRAGAPAEEVRLEGERVALMISMIKTAAKEAGLGPKHVRALGTALAKVVAEHHDDPDRLAAEDERLAKLREQIAEDDERKIQRAAAQRPPEDLAYPPEEWRPAEDAA